MGSSHGPSEDAAADSDEPVRHGARDEIARRAVHVGGTVFPAAYLLDLVTWGQLRVVLLVGAAVALGLEGVRLLVGLDWRLFDRLTREYERDNLAGYALYAISVTAVAFAFEPPIAVPAMLMLMIADPISGLLGSGELRAAKEVSVLAITFLVCFGLAWPFVPPVPAVGGALAATLADGVKPVIRGYVIDDNLTIPVAAACVIWLGVMFFLPG